jgi:hypothetical protein
MPKPQNAQEALEQFKERLGLGADKVYAAMGSFSTPEELVEAGKKIYSMGYRKLDAMSPFPVHGIDDALGIPRSKIGWIVMGFALLGMVTAQALMYYVGVINYPLVIGGKPLFDFTYTVPVTFELTRLYHPSMNYREAHRASDDRFILVVEASDPKFDPEKTAADLRSLGAQEVEVVAG